MRQEDLNELASKYPSHSLKAYVEQLKDEAISRGCACANSPGYWSSECAWDDHTHPGPACRGITTGEAP